MKVAIVNLITKTVDMPKKKSGIVGLSPTPSKKDIEVNIMELALRIGQQGNEVTVFVSDAYRPKEPLEHIGKNVRVEYLRTGHKKVFPPAYIPYTPELVNRLSSDGFDIIQSGEFFQWGTILASRSARKKGIPLVVWQELDIHPQFPGGLMQSTYNRTYGRVVRKRISSFVPRSESARRYLLGIGIPPEDISSVIHTGVNTDFFHPLNDDGLKEYFGFGRDAALVLSVGRLHPNKGFDILIKAVAKAKERIPSISLAIKGNGPQEGELRELITKLDLKGNARVISDYITREDMNKLYNAADFTAIASRVDLFPFSSLESIACGKPVVSIYGRAIELDVIANHGTGIYVSSGSVNDFADSIVHLARDAEMRLEMGKKALRLCQREFDLKVVSKRFCDLYHDIANRVTAA